MKAERSAYDPHNQEIVDDEDEDDSCEPWFVGVLLLGAAQRGCGGDRVRTADGQMC